MKPRNCSRWYRVALYAAVGLSLACGNTQAGNVSYSGGDETGTVTQLAVSNAAFVSANPGTEVKLAGSIPSGDVTVVRVYFFDAAGNPVQLDVNHDGVTEGVSLDFPVGPVAEDQRFFIELPFTQSLSNGVARVGIQVIDEFGNLSKISYASLNDLPQLIEGSLCDTRGFDACPEGTTCVQSSAAWQAHCISASPK